MVCCDQQKQGEGQVSSSHESAFAFASIAVGVWCKHPDVGELILAYFYQRCPYLVPYYIPHRADESREQYYKFVFLLFVLSLTVVCPLTGCVCTSVFFLIFVSCNLNLENTLNWKDGNHVAFARQTIPDIMRKLFINHRGTRWNVYLHHHGGWCYKIVIIKQVLDNTCHPVHSLAVSPSNCNSKPNHTLTALCGFRGCKNRPTPFPGRMSYNATKPGLALSVVYLSMLYSVLLFIRAPFMYGIVSFCLYVFCLKLFWLSCNYLPSDWLERLFWGSLTVARGYLHNAHAEEFFYCLGLYYSFFNCMIFLVLYPGPTWCTSYLYSMI